MNKSGSSARSAGAAFTFYSQGYWVVTVRGAVSGFGFAGRLPPRSAAGKTIRGNVVGIAADGRGSATTSAGYWLATTTGKVYGFGNAPALGSPATLASPLVGIAAGATGTGYVLVTAEGVVYAYGSAARLSASLNGHGYRSVRVSGQAGVATRVATPITRLRSAVVGIAASPTGTGYWLVTRNGTVIALGADRSYKSVLVPTRSVVAIASDGAGTGYFIATSTGHVYARGSAVGYGQHITKSASITGVAIAPGARGYWLLSAKGTVYGFGSARLLATVRGSSSPVIAIATDSAAAPPPLRVPATPAKTKRQPAKPKPAQHRTESAPEPDGHELTGFVAARVSAQVLRLA
jgi:hypothetical protein